MNSVLCHTVALLLLPVALRGQSPAQIARPSSNAARTWTDPSPHEVRRVRVARDVELEVLDWHGHGTPLVFLAGYGNTAHVFDGFAPQFRDRFRVVAITRRGFGTSSLALGGYDNATLARDVLAVLDSLALEQPVIIAHSFGGAEINALTALRPQRLRALVYLDGGFDFAELYADRAWMTIPIPRPPLPSTEAPTPRAAMKYAELMTGPGYPEAETRASDEWVARVAAAPVFRADSLQTWLVRGTSRARWRSIPVPALAIYGVPRSVEEKYPWTAGASPALRESAARRFAVERPLLARQRARFRAEVPQGVVREVPGGRHYVFLTHPRQVAKAIRQFVQ